MGVGELIPVFLILISRACAGTRFLRSVVQHTAYAVADNFLESDSITQARSSNTSSGKPRLAVRMAPTGSFENNSAFTAELRIQAFNLASQPANSNNSRSVPAWG
jgi:hypothetical protein